VLTPKIWVMGAIEGSMVFFDREPRF